MKQFSVLGICLILISPLVMADRLKDLANVQGVRSNQLVGYGLVVGLSTMRDAVTAEMVLWLV